ncbi:outer membrane protein assembly factor BamE, partial [Francisella tularensis subsp. holarctica]|nr:outer membrane protein assembly factor BamE [Francisella tularensis subsp. holarctica]
MFRPITKNLCLLISAFSLSACGIIQPYTAPLPKGKEIKDKKLFEI